MKAGDKVPYGRPTRVHVVVSVGPYTVRLRRPDGVTINVKRRALAKFVGETKLPSYPPEARPHVIYTPQGGKQK